MNVQASLLTITAPEDSPNTDGIHVADTQDIQISSCNIGTGIPKVSFFFKLFFWVSEILYKGNLNYIKAQKHTPQKTKSQ